MKPALFFCFWLMPLSTALAQTDLSTQAFGASSQALGSIKLFQRDAWSLFNNVGGMDRLLSSELSVAADQRFGLPELSTQALCGVLKNERGSLGIGIARYGGDLYQQHLLGLGISTTAGILSFGAKVELLQTYIEGFGSGNALQFSFGGIAELGPKFFLGAHFSNLNQAKLSKDSTQALPTQMQVGLSFFPSKNLEMQSELEKELRGAPIFKSGIHYHVKKWLSLRTGVQSTPYRLTFGFGLRKQGFGIDYAYGQNSALGRSHHLTLHLRKP